MTLSHEARASRSWGGARNRRDRASDTLSRAAASGVIAAVGHAGRIGLPLNRHVTIHWEELGITDDRAAAATGSFIDRARRQQKKLGHGFACVWVRENDSGDGSKGSHVHIVMHVAPAGAAALASQQRRWLGEITGERYRAGAVHTARIGGKLVTATASPDVHHVNLVVLVGYVLKATEAGAARDLGLTHAPEFGRIIGKRAGWSENIGAAARRRDSAAYIHDRYGVRSRLK